MTRDNFLNELSKALQAVPASEREDLLNYYVEYFEDRGIQATDSVPTELASPKAIAEEITQNIPYSQTQAASNTEYRLLPISKIETLEIRLKIAGFELEIVDIPHPELKLPHNNNGRNTDYKIDFTITGTHLRIVDEAPDEIFSKWNRITIDPVVLRLPRTASLVHASIDLNMGSTRIFGLIVEKLHLRNAMGTVKLIGGSISDLDAELKMGSFQIEKTQLNKSRIFVSMGDLRGEAKLHGEHRLKCEMGNIKLDLQQSQAETHYQTQVSLGSFRVNGERDLTNRVFDNTAPIASLFLNVNMGSIKLNFLY